MKGGDPNTANPPEPDPGNLSQSEIDSNQEATVIPWFVGTQKCAVHWVSPVCELEARPEDRRGKK